MHTFCECIFKFLFWRLALDFIAYTSVCPMPYKTGEICNKFISIEKYE